MANHKKIKESRNTERGSYKKRYKIVKELRIWLCALLAVCVGLSVYTVFFSDDGKNDLNKNVALYNDDYEVDAMMLSYLFYSEFYAMVEDENFYTQEGYGTYGLDPSLPLKDQKYTELRSFFDELMNTASAGALTTLQYYDMAMQNGLTLGEKEQKAIDDEIADLIARAKKEDMDLDEFLDYRYGPGMTEADVRRTLEFYNLAMKQYDEAMEGAFECTDEEIADYYTEHYDDYISANIMRYQLKAEYDEDGEITEECKQKAEAFAACETVEEFLALVKKDRLEGGEDEETTEEFLQECVITATPEDYKDDMADWMFSSDRKKGDSKIFYLDDYVAVFKMMRPAGKYMYSSINCRIIYVSGVHYPNAEATKKAAEDILALAKQTPTEEEFEKLVHEYSNDPQSVSYGGMCEGVVPSDLNYRCEEWVFASGREVGDIGMVELYGDYYIIYLTGFGDACWKTVAERDLIDEKVTAFQETMENYTEVEQNADVINELIPDDLATDHKSGLGTSVWTIVLVVFTVLTAAATIWSFVDTARLKKKYDYNF